MRTTNPRLLALFSLFLLPLFLGADAAPVPAPVNPADSAGEGTAIFNGKDLDGWKVPDPNPWWTVKDGILVGEQTDTKMKGNVLETKKLYQDVIVDTDVRFGDNIDSGIFLRAPHEAFQVQIGVSRSLKRDMTCSIYVAKGGYVAKAHDVDKLLKLNEWNHIRVKAVGPKFTVWLNGQEVLQYESDKYPNAGPIGLQIHPGVKMKVEFKNLRATELMPAADGGEGKSEKK